jgi:hypothetical protein
MKKIVWRVTDNYLCLELENVNNVFRKHLKNTNKYCIRTGGIWSCTYKLVESTAQWGKTNLISFLINFVH